MFLHTQDFIPLNFRSQYQKKKKKTSATSSDNTDHIHGTVCCCCFASYNKGGGLGLWGWDVFVVLLFISAPHHQGEQEEGQTRSHFIIWNASREERKGRKRGKYKSCRARSREGLVLGWDRLDAEVWGGPRHEGNRTPAFLPLFDAVYIKVNKAGTTMAKLLSFMSDYP